MRVTSALIFLAIILAATLPGVDAGGSTLATRGVVLNIQETWNRGCSDDPTGFLIFDGPDLQLRVWHEGTLLHAARHARDTSYGGLFEMVEFPDLPVPTVLTIEVREAEPGPSQNEPTWVECDVSPGPSRRYDLSVSLEAVTVTSRGESNASAEFKVRVGPMTVPHLHPVDLTLQDATSSTLTVGWTTALSEPQALQHIVSFWAGDARPAPGMRTHTFEGLDDDWPHDFRLHRQWEGWHVASPTVQFRTLPAPEPPEGPPAAPLLHVEGRAGELHVRWDAAGAGHVEVHAGATAAFAASPETLLVTGSATGTHTAAVSPANRTLHVRAIAITSGGTNATEASVFIQPLPPPTPPSAVNAYSEHDALVVSWSAPVSPGLERHDVLVRAEGEADFHTVRSTAADTANVRVTGLEPGANITIMIRAVNRDGLAAESELLSVTFVPPNEAPTLWSIRANGTHRAGQPVELALQAADRDGDALRFEVDWGDGQRDLEAQPPTARHVYASEGDYVVRVSVHDTYGATAQAEVPLTIRASTAPQIMLSTPSRARVGLAAEAHVSATDADGDPVSITIDWGDGSPLAHVERPQVTHTYQRAGEWTIRATATDESGAAARATATVLVEQNRPPYAVLQFDSATATDGSAVQVHVSSVHDADGDDVSLTIDWGDGSLSAVPPHFAASHVYARPGTYHVTLVALDTYGARRDFSTELDVRAAATSMIDGDAGEANAATADDTATANPFDDAPKIEVVEAMDRATPAAGHSATLLAVLAALGLAQGTRRRRE